MKALDAIRMFDLFGQPVSILIHDKKLHQTVIGSIVSLFVFVLVLYSLITSIMSTTQGNSPIVQTSQSRLDSTESFTFTVDNFFFATQVVSPTGQQIVNNDTARIFTVNYGICTNNNSKAACQSVPAVKCGQQAVDFAKSIGGDNYQAAQGYCLPADILTRYNVSLQGQVLSSNFAYIYQTVNKCVNSTLLNYTCASDAVINATLYSAYLITVFAKMDFDANNLKKPYQVLAQYSQMRLQPDTKKTSYITYIKSKVVTLNDFFVVRGSSKEEIGIEYSGQQSESLALEKGDPVVSMTFFILDNNQILYNRSYDTIVDILGKVGGLFSIVTSLLRIMLSYYQWFDLKIRILSYLNTEDQTLSTTLGGGKMGVSVVDYVFNKKSRETIHWQQKDIEKQVDIIEILKKMRMIEQMRKDIDTLSAKKMAGSLVNSASMRNNNGLRSDSVRVPMADSISRVPLVDVPLGASMVNLNENSVSQEPMAAHMLSPVYRNNRRLRSSSRDQQDR